MTVTSETFDGYAYAYNSGYNGITFTPTVGDDGNGADYIVDTRSSATEIDVGDPVTFYFNASQNEAISGTYLGYYLSGSVEYPFLSSNNYYYLVGQTALGTYPITQAADTQVTCYVSNTLIRTTAGDVAVEDLRVGDLVVTASGDRRPIRWLGHKTVDCRRHSRPDDAMPVRIAAHAFGPHRPSRDLWVSPGHSICVDLLGEVLIPASALVNGSTVCQVEVDQVTYWHVELESHDIILAENLAAESYLEMGNRGFFGDDAANAHRSPDGDTSLRTHADFCRPFHDGGPLVAAVRMRLRAHAETLGWTLDGNDPFAGLHLVVDGMRIDPVTRGLSARFAVPVGAKDVCLVSATSRPCDVWTTSTDVRDLGVFLAGLTIEDGFASRVIDLADPRLCAGWHEVEGSRRWTSGRAHLPSELWVDGADGFFLRADLAAPAPARWVTPIAADGNVAGRPPERRASLRLIA